MSCETIKTELIEELTKYLEKIHRLPLHPKCKLELIPKYVYSKFRWILSI